MAKTIIGLVLIDAPHSALNNAGMDIGQATENAIVVKTVQKDNEVYPYVSGQAFRNWWRTTLGEEFDWNLSPITREKKIAFTATNPVEFDDDDVFGYMKAEKKETLTRVSPLKCSPLISVSPHRPTRDFGVMARQEGNPVPYEYEFYSCVLKGILSLDLTAVGTFYDIDKTGYKNISSDLATVIEEAGGKRQDEKSPWILPKEIRVRRVQDTLKALAVLHGGAKLTSHLTDVTPKLIVLTVLDGGNHPFMNILGDKDGEPEFSVEALEQVITDYADRILDDIYIGRRIGFMDEWQPSINVLCAKQFPRHNDRGEIKVICGSPNQVIYQLAEKCAEHID